MRLFLVTLLLACLFTQAQVKIPSESRQVLLELEALAADFPMEKENILFNKYPLVKIQGKVYVSMLGVVNDKFNASLLPENVFIGSQIENIVTLKIPLQQLDIINEIEYLTYLETSPKIIPHLDRAVSDCRADSVHMGINLGMPYNGKDVIIGVQDWGFDYTHPMFYDTSLTQTRILASWDQFRTAGAPPTNFNYGTEIIGATNLLSMESDTASVYYDYATHGSHVAGIAGGSGAGLEFRGVAFGCDFLFSQFYLDAASSIDAIDWMKDFAENEGKRLVINMSWGLYHLGPPDGSSLFSQALEAFVNDDVVIVTSGGNNGDADFHIQHEFQNDTLRSRIQFFPYGAHANMWGQSISMWGEPNASFMAGFEVHDNSGHLASSPQFFTTDVKHLVDSFLIVNADTIFYKLSIDSVYAFNNRPHIRLRIRNEHTAYNIILVSSAVSGKVHYWNVTELDNGAGNWGQDFQQYNNQGMEGDNGYGTGNPASTEGIITVGAHAPEVTLPNGTIHTGVLGTFSSRGPTLDERIKPDITAPGVNVVSSISSFTTASYTSEASVNFNGRTYHFSAFSGTSMSSPVVTGIVALMLEANPNLTAQEVKEILMSTAREDDKTGSIPTAGSSEWGQGKVTANAAVQSALNYLSVSDVIVERDINIYPNPANDYIILETNDLEVNTIAIYDVKGVLKAQIQTVNNGKVILPLLNLLPGMYLIQINSVAGVYRTKFVKR